MPLSLATFTIERSGTVNWLVAGEHHCGPKDALVRSAKGPAIPVRYTVAIECEPRLDERGFLFDQAAVAKYLDALSQVEPTSLSCERLARYVAERLLAKIERDVPSCQVKALTLKFSPAPFQASITVAFR